MKRIPLAVSLVILLWASSLTAAEKNPVRRFELIPPTGRIVGDGETPYGFTLLCLDERDRPVPGAGVEIIPSGGKLPRLVEAGHGFYHFDYVPERVDGVTPVQLVLRADEYAQSLSLSVLPEEGIRLAVENNWGALVAGELQELKIALTLSGPGGEPLTRAGLSGQANVGKVVEIREEGNGKYLLSYLLPPTRYPQVALIGVLAEGKGLTGSALIAIPIRGQAKLPAETKPDSQAVIRVGELEFGPFASGPTGKFTAPIVVPPGFNQAEVAVTDNFGNVTRKNLDLGVPPVPRLVFLPEKAAVPADGRSRVGILAFSADAFGKPAEEGFEFSVDRGHLAPARTLEPGKSRMVYFPPADGREGRVTIQAARAGQMESSIELRLRQGHFPFLLTLAAQPQSLVADGISRSQLEACLFDDYGRAVTGVAVDLQADRGILGKIVEKGAGFFGAGLVSPLGLGEGKGIRVTAYPRLPRGEEGRSWLLRREIRIGLKTGKPEKIKVETQKRNLQADGKTTAEIRLQVADRAGNPVPGESLVVNPALGAVEKVEDLGQGKYRFAYKTPRSYQYAREEILISNSEKDFSHKFTLGLVPKLRYFHLGLKAGFLTNFGAVSTGKFRAEAGIRLPALNRRFFVNFGFGYFPEGKKHQGDSQELGEYSVTMNLNVYTATIEGIYKFEGRGRLVPYLGLGTGAYFTSSRISSSFQPTLVESGRTWGAYGVGGVEMRAGPGAGLFEVLYDYAPLSSGREVSGNLGGLTTNLGYRLMF